MNGISLMYLSKFSTFYILTIKLETNALIVGIDGGLEVICTAKDYLTTGFAQMNHIGT